MNPLIFGRIPLVAKSIADRLCLLYLRLSCFIQDDPNKLRLNLISRLRPVSLRVPYRICYIRGGVAMARALREAVKRDSTMKRDIADTLHVQQWYWEDEGVLSPEEYSDKRQKEAIKQVEDMIAAVRQVLTQYVSVPMTKELLAEIKEKVSGLLPSDNDIDPMNFIAMSEDGTPHLLPIEELASDY